MVNELHDKFFSNNLIRKFESNKNRKSTTNRHYTTFKKVHGFLFPSKYKKKTLINKKKSFLNKINGISFVSSPTILSENCVCVHFLKYRFHFFYVHTHTYTHTQTINMI